ncbi:MAG: biotin/lipoyl-binding protein [Dehalococcoidia bacterium]|nr:MAG: biotin/lipoyl-binding protein [Dehalococcoidia bacterium]
MAEKYLMRLGDALREVEVEEGPKGLRVRVNDRWHTISLEQIGHTGLFSLIVDNRPYEFFTEERSGGFDIVIGSRAYSVLLETPGKRVAPVPARPVAAEPEAGDWVVLSPMMGIVREVRVSQGDTVKAGDILVVIEAMKMNNDLKAQRAGRVQRVYVSPGERVEEGRALLLLA